MSLPCRCGSKTGYHQSHCPLRYAGTVIQEDLGAEVAASEMKMDSTEAACMRMYDQVLDSMGGHASPGAVTRVCELALEIALRELRKYGEFEASHVITMRLDWFATFAPR